jgi:hypothetical protein
MKKSKKKISLEEKVQIRPRVMSEKEISELVGGSFTLANVANILETLRVCREKLKWEKETTKHLKAKLRSRDRNARARLGITTLPRG